MLRKITILCAVALCVLIAVYVVIDRRVARRLNNLSAPGVPAVYSAPFPLSSVFDSSDSSHDNARFIAQTKKQLENRRYIELNSTPAHPGEFRINGSRLEIFTREFKKAEGSEQDSQLYILDADARNITTKDGNEVSALSLEPQVVSFFGSEELRASHFVPIDEIPKSIQDAVLAIEDERFYKHFGLDLIGLGRAVVRNIISFRLVEGGSTITQQLAKNLVLSPKRTLSRKFLELFAALSIESRLPKNKILELYLNEVYLGQEGPVGIHGVAEASQAFFGKKLSDITVSEAALLAGIIKAPSIFSPRRHSDRAKERRNTVLLKMKELGYISENEFHRSIRAPIKITSTFEHRRLAPHFTVALKDQLAETFDFDAAMSAGLSVQTGLDLEMQTCAEQAVTAGLDKIQASGGRTKNNKKRLEGALVAIEPYSGLVRAWAGGRDYNINQFDHVSQAQRQIGSTIKPFLYLTALDQNLNTYKVATAANILEDKPIVVSQDHQADWTPENYDHQFRGDVTLRYALENSLNAPAVYVAERVGFKSVAHTAELFGLAEKVPAVPALALGALDTSLLRMTAAYGALANGGIYVKPRMFVSAFDSSGDVLATSTIDEARAADESSVFVLTNILEGVVNRGTANVIRRMSFDRPAAGKTGTSDKSRDAWFIGFTPNLVAGVWVGYDDNHPTGLTGATAAVPIWAEFMKCIDSSLPDVGFVPPRSVTFVNIDKDTGELFSPACPPENQVREVFIRGTEPTRFCSTHSSGGPPQRQDNPEEERREPKPRQRRERSFWESLFG